METEQLTEYAANQSRLQINGNVIRNVKILGTQSANGRSYPPETLRQAAGLYEKAKVNVNHPAGRNDSQRDYADRLGHLENVVVKPSGLYGDLVFNPKHPLAEQLVWDAENSPTSLGLSHNVMAVVGRKNGKQVVERINRVVSVDIVADPATSSGLFESTEGDADLDTELEDARAEFAETKRQLVESIARDIGLDAEFIPDADGGLATRDDAESIREYLLRINEKVQHALHPHGKQKLPTATLLERDVLGIKSRNPFEFQLNGFVRTITQP